MQDIDIPAQCLPRPNSKHQNSLRRAMGLTLHGPAFTLFTKNLRAIADRHLDRGKRFDERAVRDWDAYMTEACAALPFVKQYENAWPVEFYMKKYINRIRHDIRQQRGLTTTNLKLKHTLEHHLDSLRNDGHQYEHTSMTRDEKFPRPVLHINLVKDPIVCQEDTDIRKHIPTQPAPLYEDDTSDTTNDTRTIQSNLPEEVRSLLVAHGVDDELWLKHLIAMPVVERNAFLLDDLKLNAFQYRLVRAALFNPSRHN